MQKPLQQIAFSGIFFDVVFGLLIFFHLDDFLEISDPLHFVFYLVGVLIVTHWWMLFKSVDDMFSEEASRSFTDLVIGIFYLILLAFLMKYVDSFDYFYSTLFVLALILLDLVWALMWKFIGKWRTKKKYHKNQMERELTSTIFVDLAMALIFGGLLYIMWQFTPVPWIAVTLFTLLYLLFIYLTFRTKIIDIQFF